MDMNENDKRRLKERQKGRSRKKRERSHRVLIYKGIIIVAAVLIASGVCWALAGLISRGEPGREEIEMEQSAEETLGNLSEEITDTPATEAETVPESDIQTSVSEEEGIPPADGREDMIRENENPGIANVSDYLNIREEADEGASIVGRLPANEVCEVLEEGETWCHIRFGDVEGYVNRTYLLIGEDVREE